MSTFSLRKRLLVGATFMLIAFLGLAGVALDRAFILSSKSTVKNQLKTQVNALLTVLEIDENGQLIFPERMPETRLTSPNSGLYAIILDEVGGVIWRSQSSVGISLDYLEVAEPGRELFFQINDRIDSPFYYSFGITWEIDLDREVQLSLIMITESRNYLQFIRSHRQELVFWLGMAGLLLLIMQAISLRWGLRPLGQVIEELDLIEHSKQKKILGSYPDEIAQLSMRINLFIENERKNLTRYRNTLGDLAHSLKTPLAVIKGITESGSKIDRSNLGEHVERMNKIVEYQLKRAASSQFSIMHGAINIGDVLKKLDASLQKVYAEKNLESQWEIESGSIFYGDESDLYELLGNIMDNAYKWANSIVRYHSSVNTSKGEIHQGLIIEIHDDGPGIAVSERNAVFQRGARVDQQTPGQGIGLAVVREIVERYDGKLDLESSALGGTLIRASFPAK